MQGFGGAQRSPEMPAGTFGETLRAMPISASGPSSAPKQWYEHQAVGLVARLGVLYAIGLVVLAFMEFFWNPDTSVDRYQPMKTWAGLSGAEVGALLAWLAIEWETHSFARSIAGLSVLISAASLTGFCLLIDSPHTYIYVERRFNLALSGIMATGALALVYMMLAKMPRKGMRDDGASAYDSLDVGGRVPVGKLYAKAS